MGPLDQLPVSCPGPSQHEDVLHVKCPIRMADGTTMSLLSYLFLAHAMAPPLCHTHNPTLPRSWFDSSTQLLPEGFLDALNGHEDKPQGS